MKKTILTLALVGASAAATFAQGTIQFLNSGLSPVKYVDVAGAAAVNAPTGSRIGVFWGTSRENLTLQTPTTSVGATLGVFSGGSAYALPGTNPGETVFLKFEGWLNKGGTTPESILGGVGGVGQGVTHWGGTETVQTTVLGPSTGPGTVVWQSATGSNVNRVKAFTIAPVVPEPSVIALGALGLGALLLRRRKA
jgi:hypothetical protein